MDLDQARNKVSETTKVAGEYAAGSNTITDVLKQKVNEIYDYNKDIVEPLDQATAKYMSSPATAREKYQDTFNPFTKEKLVSQYVSNQMIPMLALGNIFGTRQGSIADTINAGTNAYNAQGTQAVNAANLAQSEYNNLLKEYELTQKSSANSFDPANIAAVLKAMGFDVPGGQTDNDTGGLENDPTVFDPEPKVSYPSQAVTSILDPNSYNNEYNVMPGTDGDWFTNTFGPMFHAGTYSNFFKSLLGKDNNEPYKLPVQTLDIKLPK